MPTQARTRIPYGKRSLRLLGKAGTFVGRQRKRPQTSYIDWDRWWADFHRFKTKWESK